MDSKVLDVLSDRVLELGPKPGASGPYRNFKLTRDTDGVAWVLFDRADASANTLSSEVMEEFGAILTALENQPPAGIVIRSAKTSGFIAGADVNEFRGASDPREVETTIGRAHAHHRPAGGAEDSERRRDPRLLPRRRARGSAGVPNADRHRRCAVRFPGSDARPASRPRRHRAVYQTGQSDAGDDADADRQDHRCAQSEVARPCRCRDAGAPRPQRGEGCGRRPAEARPARSAESAA